MTAIVAILTKDGFIIGADGRQLDSLSATLQTEKAQKIFPFKDGRVSLAYAWTGMTTAIMVDEIPVIDLRRLTKEILPTAALLSQGGFPSFMAALCDGLRQELPAAFDPPGLNCEIARGIFSGYAGTKPCEAYIKIGCVNSELHVAIEDIHIPAQPHKTIFTGAKSIRPEEYDAWNPSSGLESIKFVQQYIQECANSHNADCEGIGGHIHIAHVTAEGFYWINPPISD